MTLLFGIMSHDVFEARFLNPIIPTLPSRNPKIRYSTFTTRSYFFLCIHYCNIMYQYRYNEISEVEVQLET